MNHFEEQIRLLHFPNFEEIWNCVQECINDSHQYTAQTTAIFVSDYIIGKERQAKTLYLFNTSFVSMYQKFTQAHEMTLLPINHKIISLDMKKKAFENPDAPSVTSRFSVDIHLLNGKSFDMKATGKNCQNLDTLIREYLLPNICM